MAATALTTIAAADPSAANDGVAGAISNFNSALANGHVDLAGIQPGVKFSITISAPSGTVASPTFAVAESASGYDITVTPKSTTGTGNGTTSAMLAAFNLDVVCSQIAVMSLHAGSDGSGVINAGVSKASSSGETLPTVYPAQALADADVSNGNTYTNTGYEILVIDNTDSAPSQVKLTSTDTLTTKTVVVDGAKVAQFRLPLATWGAAPVINAIDTGVKLAVVSGSSVKAATEASVAAGTDTTFDSPTEIVAAALTAIDVYIDGRDALGVTGKDARWAQSLRADLNRFKRRLGSRYIRHDGQ